MRLRKSGHNRVRAGSSTFSAAKLCESVWLWRSGCRDVGRVSSAKDGLRNPSMTTDACSAWSEDRWSSCGLRSTSSLFCCVRSEELLLGADDAVRSMSSDVVEVRSSMLVQRERRADRGGEECGGKERQVEREKRGSPKRGKK